jgi:hypothetical protein
MFDDNSITHLCPGGVGGAGGAGGAQGQGGGGGTGEGPELNYAFDAIENFTMNNLYVERAPLFSLTYALRICSGLQIRDSNLYTVSGDVSLVIQNSQLRDSHLRLPALGRSLELEADWSERSDHRYSGATRNLHLPHHEIGTRHTPYSTSPTTSTCF